MIAIVAVSIWILFFVLAALADRKIARVAR